MGAKFGDIMRNHIDVRKFLNRKGYNAQGFILARVSDTSTCRERNCSHEWCRDIELSIGDCSRYVRLDFEVSGGPGQRRNSLHKIDLLVEVLTEFRDALRVEAEREAEYEKDRKAKERNSKKD